LSLATIQKQNVRFKEALSKGEITPAQYEYVMQVQSERAAKLRQSAPHKQPTEWGFKEETPEQKQSLSFYSRVGYPQFAGKYEALDIPEGYEIADIKEKTIVTERSKGGEVTTEKTLDVILMPKFQMQTNVSYFGVQSYREPTAEEKEKIRQQYLAGELQVTTFEQKALTGLGLATVAAGGIITPMAGASSIAALGVAETGKVLLTGQHLTVEEAVLVAGGAQMVYFTATSPFVKQSFGKLKSKVFPERTMYDRVVKSAQPQKTPIGSKSWVEKIVAKVSPERALYNRAIKPRSVPSDSFKAVSSSARQWVVSEVLIKKAPVQKTPMKNFTTLTQAHVKALTITAPAISVTKSTQTTQQKTRPQKTLTLTIQQRQQANPFLQYEGKPFYRQRSKEETELEYIIYSYPGSSPFSHPGFLSETLTRGIQKPSLSPIIEGKLGYSYLQDNLLMGDSALIQRQQNAQIQDLIQLQKQEQLQRQTQQQKQAQQQTRMRRLHLDPLELPDRRKKRKGRLPFSYLKGERKHPILSAAQFSKKYNRKKIKELTGI
jgi:hypothetical protein